MAMAIIAPIDSPTTWARSTSSRSSAATTPSASPPIVYGGGAVGLAPWPGRSTSTQRLAAEGGDLRVPHLRGAAERAEPQHHRAAAAAGSLNVQVDHVRDPRCSSRRRRGWPPSALRRRPAARRSRPASRPPSRWPAGVRSAPAIRRAMHPPPVAVRGRRRTARGWRRAGCLHRRGARADGGDRVALVGHRRRPPAPAERSATSATSLWASSTMSSATVPTRPRPAPTSRPPRRSGPAACARGRPARRAPSRSAIRSAIAWPCSPNEARSPTGPPSCTVSSPSSACNRRVASSIPLRHPWRAPRTSSARRAAGACGRSSRRLDAAGRGEPTSPRAGRAVGQEPRGKRGRRASPRCRRCPGSWPRDGHGLAAGRRPRRGAAARAG